MSKAHFTHACKLFHDGNRTLFNEGKVQLALAEENKEGKKIVDEGVLCCVYNEQLWDDAEALMAIMDVDNEDADIEMGEDDLVDIDAEFESLLTKTFEKESRAVSGGEI